MIQPRPRARRPELAFEAPATPVAPKKSSFLAAFEQVWSSLFSSPVHLDSALSKQTKSLKPALASIVPQLLLRPSSECEALGVGVPAGEPWRLAQAALSTWRPARIAAERMFEARSAQGVTRPSRPVQDDFPPHLYNEWQARWGTAAADELVQVLAQEAPLSLRATTQLGAQALLSRLTEGSRLPVRARVSSFAPFGVTLEGYAAVLQTESYEQGAFEIQDEGSQWMALFALSPEDFGSYLQEKPGRISAQAPAVRWPVAGREGWAPTVIDACAGAGGKSLAIADALGGKGRVFAYDTSLTKLQALKRRASRAGLRNIQTTKIEDGKEAETVARFRRRADVVLVDAPCSGWGVLRRNPDIKWRQPLEVLERMPKIQSRLLDVYSELVAPGGTLVYGVCTFREQESTEVVRKFAETHPEFRPTRGGYLGPGPCDGFFMQAFVREKKQ